MLLACLMACREQTVLLAHSLLGQACREQTALLAHSLLGRLACLARHGLSWPAYCHCSNRPSPLPPWSTGRHVQSGGPRGSVGSASEGEAGEAEGRPWPSPSLLHPPPPPPELASRSLLGAPKAKGQLHACRRRAIARAASQERGQRARRRGWAERELRPPKIR